MLSLAFHIDAQQLYEAPDGHYLVGKMASRLRVLGYMEEHADTLAVLDTLYAIEKAMLELDEQIASLSDVWRAVEDDDSEEIEAAAMRRKNQKRR